MCPATMRPTTMRTILTTLLATLSLAATAGDNGSLPGGPTVTATYESTNDVADLQLTLTDVGLGYAATSVNTPVFRAHALTTGCADSLQLCAFYDPQGRVTIASRTPGDSSWHCHDTGLRGDVTDAHRSISIALDSQGTLHLSYGHHGDTLKYYTSPSFPATPLQPARMTGDNEQDVTYPEFHALPDGRMLFAYRAGHSGGGNLVLNRLDPATGRWERLHDNLLDGQGERNAYWQLHVDSKGGIHLSWVWRETWMVETNHDMCYAFSNDGGTTWMRSDSTLYTLPINAATAELAWPIPQGSELINQTSMTTGRDGHPVIATYWRQEGDSVPQYRIIWHDGTQWESTAVSRRTTPFTLAGGGTKMIPIARPRIVNMGDRLLMIARDAAHGSHVEAYCGTPGGQWERLTLLERDMGAWEPCIDPRVKDNSVDIFIQATTQGDGERTTTSPPTPVQVLTVKTLQ